MIFNEKKKSNIDYPREDNATSIIYYMKSAVCVKLDAIQSSSSSSSYIRIGRRFYYIKGSKKPKKGMRSAATATTTTIPPSYYGRPAEKFYGRPFDILYRRCAAHLQQPPPPPIWPIINVCKPDVLCVCLCILFQQAYHARRFTLSLFFVLKKKTSECKMFRIYI